MPTYSARVRARPARLNAAQVLTAMMNGSTYGSIAPGPIRLKNLPANTVVNATTAPLSIVTAGGATQAAAEVTINDLAGDYVNGSSDSSAQLVTMLHELGHAMNDIFGPNTSGIAPDGASVPNGWQISMGNTQLVDTACIKGFAPPPPTLQPGQVQP